jgi:RNA polymerase sigma factor (sigma-70 family)
MMSSDRTHTGAPAAAVETPSPDASAGQESLASLDLVRRWCAGDEGAARRLHDRYAERLVRLVSSRLGARLRRRFEAEEVVQSALASVFVHARDGDPRLAEGGRLWPFLVHFTLNKLRNRIRANLRGQRSVARECGEGADVLAAVAARGADPGAEFEEAEELAALLAELRGALPEETHRRILDLALEGHGQGAIARQVNRSERTVSRVLAGVRSSLEARLAGGAA